MRVLGLSASYHDSAAALVEDGRIIAAAQEERFTRRKHDSSFPRNALAYCLSEAGISLDQVDLVVFDGQPFAEGCLSQYPGAVIKPDRFQSFEQALSSLSKEKPSQQECLLGTLLDLSGRPDWRNKLVFADRHLSQISSAYFPSPFDEAAVLTMEGAGEGIAISIAVGRGNDLKPVREQPFPHSLGLLYSAFTSYTGFRAHSGEYKVMGLAPYGEPRYAPLILDKIVHSVDDGFFCLDQSFFDDGHDLNVASGRLAALFGQKVRNPDDPLTQFHMDMAASVQAVTGEIVLRLTRGIARETGLRDLCLAGGVALNCVANGKVLRDGAFERIWVQPASGDAGGALGAALAGYYIYTGCPRPSSGGADHMAGAFLGPSFAQADIERRLTAAGAKFSILGDEDMIDATAGTLADGRAVGWMQGRMEFGPRALGGRSILGDPRSPRMRNMFNLNVKYRENFRPFAPSVLREDVADWFDLDTDSPYMLMVAPVAERRRREPSAAENALPGIDKLTVPRSEIPAVTHVDYSARVQTVHKETNPRYHALISRFKALTGCPVVLNTSFNVRGEPIVNSPEDAFRCFMGSRIEALVIGNAFLRKEDQDPALILDYKNAFEPD